MELNFTLIIQMGHFFVAYTILRRYLFKPLVAIVYQEDAAMAELEQAVQARKVVVTQDQQSLQERWENERAYLGRLAPTVQDIQPYALESMKSPPSLPVVDKEQVVQLQHEVKAQLIKKVERVH